MPGQGGFLPLCPAWLPRQQGCCSFRGYQALTSHRSAHRRQGAGRHAIAAVPGLTVVRASSTFGTIKILNSIYCILYIRCDLSERHRKFREISGQSGAIRIGRAKRNSPGYPGSCRGTSRRLKLGKHTFPFGQPECDVDIALAVPSYPSPTSARLLWDTRRSSSPCRPSWAGDSAITRPRGAPA